jgi:hypothetical protein
MKQNIEIKVRVPDLKGIRHILNNAGRNTVLTHTNQFRSVIVT